LFSKNGGEKPLDRSAVYANFHKALMNIGMTKEVIVARKIHLHSWRHFFNTQLLKGGLSVKQTQAVSRHKSEDMTDNYLHFDESGFAKAMEIQDSLLEPVQEKAREGTADGSKTQGFAVISVGEKKTA
jgi:integrase